jgi:glycosyltransferase involved in cell wall biosynthesis
MKVHVFSMAHNESNMIRYFIRHYRRCFPDCDITIFDNESTDDTASISQELGCKVIPVISCGLVDQILLDTKNECWKQCNADWVVVCDTDEFLQINQVELENLDRCGVTVLYTKGFDMVGENENPEMVHDKYPNPQYCKCICFNPSEIKEINYAPGAHHCNPIGHVQFSKLAYELYHYKFISLDLTIKRNKLRCDRISEDNRQKGWAQEYFEFNEKKIRDEYASAWRKAIVYRLLGMILPTDGYQGYHLAHKFLSRLP